MALGDIVGTLTAVGGAATSFELINNPGGFFSIAGTNLIQTGDTPDGIYPITIKAIGPGYQATTSYSLDFTGATTPFPPPPPPPPPLTSAIAVTPSTLGVGQTATVFFTWNDTVFNFTLGAVAVTNGSIGTLTQVSPTLFTAIFTPTPNVNATATLQVQESGVGGAVYFNAAHSTTIASNIANVAVNTIAPTGEFFVSINLTGAQGQAPVFPGQAVINYHATRLNRSGPFRIPICWSIPQSFAPFGVVGIQPAAFGNLDTTGSYSFVPPGPNFLQNSQALASGPWTLFANGTGSGSRTGNSGVGPDGSNTATLITLNRADAVSYAITTQTFPASAANWTGSVWLKAATGADIGKVVSINFNDGVHGPVDITPVTLTNSWVRYSCTGILTSATWSFTIGYSPGDGAGTVPVSLLASQAQTNLGTSPATYQETTGGYLAALNSVIQYAVAAGVQCYIDIHMFGGGPGISGQFSVSLSASGTTVSATYAGAAVPLANGSIVSIGTPSTAFNGNFTVFNVTPTTFQYTIGNSTTGSTTGFGAETANIGTPRLPNSAFADLWGKIAAYYVSQPALLAGIYGFDLMNEWQFVDSAIAFDANQAAITAIRANGYTGPIIIEGVNFTSAWNWTSGQGQSFNNSLLYQLVDPLNKLIFSPHMYPDYDDSGQNYSYSINLATPGQAPPGLNTNPTIGVERMSREYVPWAQEHGVVSILGEYGSSNDTPWQGGLFDFSDWNAITRNLLTYLRDNNIGFNIWSGGPGFLTGFNSRGYAYSMDPFNVDQSGNPDFTSTGVQHPAMVMLDEFTGYSGPQPQAYMLFQPGLATPQIYCTIGSPSNPFTVYYGGLISSPVTITPHAFLTDGVTPVSGTFSPTSLTAAPGENFVGTFTFTASEAATIVISTTNSAGWIDPPGLGISSVLDGYVHISGSPSNIYGMYNRYTPNIGPALQLQRVTDGQIMDWYLTLPNSLGYNGFDRVAIQTWASANSGIKVLTRYDMSGNGNHLTFSGATLPTLNLQNTAGYPEIVYPGGCLGVFNTPINGRTQFYTIARFNMNALSAGGLYRMDWFNGPIGFCESGQDNFTIVSTGQPPPVPPVPAGMLSQLSVGLVKGAFHDYGVSYASGVTNGFVSYKDGTQVDANTTTYILGADNQTQVNFAYFRFGGPGGSPGAFFIGSDYNMEIGMGFALTAGQHSTIASIDNTYYSTPLPDTLPTVPPLIAGAVANQPIFPGTITARPFLTIVVTDTNPGSPTDSATITLSGAAGTLSGSGISGTGPYTIAAASAASVTATLQGAVFTTANTLGHTTTFTIAVTSSAGSSSSNGGTSTVVTAYTAQPNLTPPGGTFTGTNYCGYAFSGAELVAGGFNSLWPQNFQVDYLQGKGFGLMRFVITSKFLYTTAFGLLNASYLAGMKQVIDYCFTKNIRVLIDVHNFGGIWNSNVNGFQDIHPNTVTQDLFQDMWRRISAAFLNYPNVVFGLMNEPSAPGVNAAQWRDGGVIPPIAAIRANGCTQLITIPGVGFSSALGWASNGNSTAFAGFNSDPGNNFCFEAHQYLDSTAQGVSPVSTINGSTVMNTFNTFLSANSFRGYLGEFGISWDPWYPISPGNQNFDSAMTTPEVTNNIIQTTNQLNSIIATGNYIGWAEFSGGNEFATPPTFNGYYFNPEPQRASSSAYVIPIVDQPGMATLVAKII